MPVLPTFYNITLIIIGGIRCMSSGAKTLVTHRPISTSTYTQTDSHLVSQRSLLNQKHRPSAHKGALEKPLTTSQ